MSIKRSKQQSYSRRSGDDAPGFSQAPEQSWEERVNGQPESAFAPYSLTTTFAKESLLLHPKFGKGVVVAVDGGHVDVLFAEGKKTLGHGKSSPAMPPRPRRIVEEAPAVEPGLAPDGGGASNDGPR